MRAWTFFIIKIVKVYYRLILAQRHINFNYFHFAVNTSTAVSYATDERQFLQFLPTYINFTEYQKMRLSAQS